MSPQNRHVASFGMGNLLVRLSNPATSSPESIRCDAVLLVSCQRPVGDDVVLVVVFDESHELLSVLTAYHSVLLLQLGHVMRQKKTREM